MLRLFIIFFTLAQIISCRENKTVAELHKYFYENKPLLDTLVANLRNNKMLDSLFRISPDSGLPNIKKQFPYEFKILKECGITDASSHGSDIIDRRWYYFRTNWPCNYPILLSWYPKKYYDSSQNEKGYYQKDHYKNEWWGLGDGWQMMRLVKTIDYIKL